MPLDGTIGSTHRGALFSSNPVSDPMSQRYEYEFVRLGEGLMSARKEAKQDYQDTVHTYARKGWRLVQVFDPGTGAYGAAKYFELIFERPVSG